MTLSHPFAPPSRQARSERRAAGGLGSLLLLLTLGLGACASPPPTDVPMAVADAAVRRASSTATGEAAPDELRVATGKLADARAAIAKGEFARALRLAEQATVDAQVAELHAQAYRARQAAVESEAAARALREELNRKAVR
jgi:Domain of unknown function (DUF4398)